MDSSLNKGALRAGPYGTALQSFFYSRTPLKTDTAPNLYEGFFLFNGREILVLNNFLFRCND